MQPLLLNREVGNFRGDSAAAIYAGDQCAEVCWRVIRDQRGHYLNMRQSLFASVVTAQVLFDAAGSQLQSLNG